MRLYQFLSVPFASFLFLAAAASAQALPSPIQQKITGAQKRIQADPKAWQPYDDLATAYCRAGRDTGDPAQYDQAEAAIEHLRQLSGGNYEAQKLHIAVLLGKHDYANALKLARELNKKGHDDIAVWGLLVDANVGLDNTAEAERAAQWILDLRPGSALGFEKAAGLRELFNDPEGAIEFYNEANRRTSQNDVDQRAWFLTQVARIELTRGNSKQSEVLVEQALSLFPDSQLAAGLQKRIKETAK